MAISFNDNIRISAPKPLDAKYLNTSNLPYTNVAEVNSTILESERYIGLTVNINNVEYWYDTGVTNGDLVIKASTSDSYVSGGTLSGTTLLLGRTEELGDVNIELSGITNYDKYVTGATYSASTLSLQRSQGLPDVTVTLGISGVTDGVVTGATLSGDTLVLERSLGLSNVTADLSSLSSNIYVSGGTLDGSAQLILNRSEGQSDVTIDLSPLSAGTSNDLYTGLTPSTITLGGLTAGAILTGRSYTDILQEMLVVYQLPAFGGAPTIGAQPTTVEVGTTLSGSTTFTWSTTNSGNVSGNSIAIYDVNGTVYLETGLANDGTQATTINTIILNSNGALQQWRMEGTNTNSGLFTSPNRTVTARYNRYFGATVSSPIDSTTVKALPSNAFQTSNSNVFSFSTGSVLTKFVVALPPSRTISNVIDLDALSADITSQYVSTGTINVLDAGGTNRLYNIYEMNIGSPYASSHNHQIQTA